MIIFDWKLCTRIYTFTISCFQFCSFRLLFTGTKSFEMFINGMRFILLSIMYVLLFKIASTCFEGVVYLSCIWLFLILFG